MGFLVPLIAGAAFAASTAGIITAAALNVAFAVGASLVASKLAPKPRERNIGGVELDLRVDPDVPQSLIVGRATTAGSLFYGESYGSNNESHIEGIALADHPCTGLVQLFVDGKPETWTTATENNTVTAYTDAKGNHNLQFRFWDGTQTVADPFAVAVAGTMVQRRWTSAMVGRGVTYVRLRWGYHAELVPGPLRTRYVVDGIKLYDPRADSTVGGSGSQRFDQLGTHVFTRNLVVIAYNILRGIRVADAGGTPRHFYGLEGTPAANLPLGVWFAAMNAADQMVDGEPQFWGGAEISVDTEPLEAIREILKACDGRLCEIGGVYKIYVGAPGVPIFSFSDGLIRADSEDVFRPILPLEERINHVTGMYTSPEDGWVPKIAPSRTNTTGETMDGRRVPGDFDAPFVQSGKHAQRMMKQMLAKARKERRHRIPLPPSAWGLEPGDIVEWTSNRNGYTNKLFEIEAVEDYHDLSTMVSMVEVDETDYDWNPGADLKPEVEGTLVTERPPPQVFVDWSVAPYTLINPATGLQRPAIQLFWNSANLFDAVAILYEVRYAVTEELISVGSTANVDHGSVIISENLLANTTYEARGRYQPGLPRETEWSDWLSVTTPNILFSSFDIFDNAILTQHINDAAVSASKIMDEAVTELKLAAEAVTAAKIAAEAVTEEAIAPSAVTTAKLDALSVTTEKLAAGSIAGDKIAANSIGADQIAANSITTKEMIITNFDNLISNAGFETGFAPHSFTSSGGSWIHGTNTPRSGGFQAAYDPAGQSAAAFINLNGDPTDYGANVKCAVGDQFYAEVYGRSASGTGRSFRIVIRFHNAAGTALQTTNGNTIASSTTYQRSTVNSTAPAGTAYVQARVEVLNTGGTTILRIDDAYMRRRMTGELIVEGSIIADNLAVNSITTNKITINGVTENAEAYTAGTISGIGNSAVEIQTLTIGTSSDYKVLLQIMATLDRDTSSGTRPGFNVFRNGVLQRGFAVAWLSDNNQKELRTMLYIDTNPPNGSTTYSVQAANTLIDGTTRTFTAYNRTIIASVLKR